MKIVFPFHGQVGYQKSRGVTLIEALIAIGVMAILVVAGILFINQNARSWNRQAISTRLDDQLRAVEARITLDIRKSYSVTATTSGISLVFSQTGTTTSYCQYYSQGNILFRQLNSEIPDPITKNNIVSATFTPTPVGSPTADAVLISISGSESQGTETISKTISFTVRLRNVVAIISPPTTSPLPNPPSVTTVAASSITKASATLNGTVNPKGAASIVWFEWGTSSTYTSSTPAQAIVAGTLVVPFSAPISGLSSNATYYFRAVGQNAGGISNGDGSNFTTKKK